MATVLTVTSDEFVTPAIKRLWFRSDDLSAFEGSDFTDRYVKLVFPRPGVHYPDGLDMRQLRGTMPPDLLPAVRTYTALFPDLAAGTLAIDFVIHGDEGVAGPWAQAARPGDTLLVNGPGGGYRPDPSADWHLLVGDEAAVPAVAAALSVLPDDAVARVVLLVDDAAAEPGLSLPSDAEVQFVHRTEQPDEAALARAVRNLAWLPGRVHAFVHGEAQEIMRGVRPHLFGERALGRDQVSISGYWRRGRTEEGFRRWKAELADAESGKS
jgi:NADPH-dependent ferric siderophore reductase